MYALQEEINVRPVVQITRQTVNSPFDPEIADEIPFVLDNKHLLQVKGHFYSFDHVIFPFINVGRNVHNGHHPEWTMQPFYLSMLIHHQNASGAYDFEQLQNIFPVFFHTIIL